MNTFCLHSRLPQLVFKLVLGEKWIAHIYLQVCQSQVCSAHCMPFMSPVIFPFCSRAASCRYSNSLAFSTHCSVASSHAVAAWNDLIDSLMAMKEGRPSTHFCSKSMVLWLFSIRVDSQCVLFCFRATKKTQCLKQCVPYVYFQMSVLHRSSLALAMTACSCFNSLKRRFRLPSDDLIRFSLAHMVTQLGFSILMVSSPALSPAIACWFSDALSVDVEKVSL